jgi:hypothetical protein
VDWDLGLEGLLLLAAASIGVGLVTQLVFAPSAPLRLWITVSVVYFVVGVWITDAWFGWTTTDELSFEDLLLIALAPMPAVVLVTRSIVGKHAPRATKAHKPARDRRHPTPRAL